MKTDRLGSTILQLPQNARQKVFGIIAEHLDGTALDRFLREAILAGVTIPGHDDAQRVLRAEHEEARRKQREAIDRKRRRDEEEARRREEEIQRRKELEAFWQEHHGGKPVVSRQGPSGDKTGQGGS